ncbi:MAG: SPASM domain-containing protein [Bacilli bacterium]|nr:SPASM domain-containing protein [Bacilli bacterium]
MIKEVKIEVTEACKRWCIHCSSKAKDVNFQYLDEELVKRIIREAVLLKAESIVFTGGEATLYPALENVIAYAHENGVKTKLYTMCNPDEESIGKIKKLVTYGLDEIIYSTTYHLTRDNIVSLEKLQAFFPKLLQETVIKLGFHHTITNETVHDIDDIIELFFSLPQDQTTNLSFLRFVPHGRGTKDLLLSKKGLLWFKETMIEYQKEYGDKIRLGSPWNFLGITHTPCSAAENTMIVGFDGRVYPCDAMKYFDYLGSGGNIYDSSLKEIYNSTYFQNIRNFKICASMECLSCSNFKICKGGCLGQKMVDFMDTVDMTFKDYGEMAKRTMNNFENNEIKKMNGQMGVVGEIGELVDGFKKYKTHNLNEESKNILLQNLQVEIGDIVWYLSASLASSYNFTFEDIGLFLFGEQKQEFEIYSIDDCSILNSIKRKDPECFSHPRENKIKISMLDHIEYTSYDFEKEWKNLVLCSCEIIYASEMEEVIASSSSLLLSLSKLAHMELNVSMEEILKKNIEKLMQRYSEGFDRNVASSRIELLTNYKNSEPEKKPYIKK